MWTPTGWERGPGSSAPVSVVARKWTQLAWLSSARRQQLQVPIVKHRRCENTVQRAHGLPLAYALTRIYCCTYIKAMESAFKIIAEPNRRSILNLLASSRQSVGEIERRLGMPQPTVSKHLRVLREAGFVEATADAQRRLYRLKPEPLQEVDAWLAQFRQFWSARVDALERHLNRMDPSTAMKRKIRRRR